MDPNETLRLLRERVRDYWAEESPIAKLDYADAIAAYFESLDGWLSTGGFKPSDWERP